MVILLKPLIDRNHPIKILAKEANNKLKEMYKNEKTKLSFEDYSKKY